MNQFTIPRAQTLRKNEVGNSFYSDGSRNIVSLSQNSSGSSLGSEEVRLSLDELDAVIATFDREVKQKQRLSLNYISASGDSSNDPTSTYPRNSSIDFSEPLSAANSLNSFLPTTVSNAEEQQRPFTDAGALTLRRRVSPIRTSADVQDAVLTGNIKDSEDYHPIRLNDSLNQMTDEFVLPPPPVWSAPFPVQTSAQSEPLSLETFANNSIHSPRNDSAVSSFKGNSNAVPFSSHTPPGQTKRPSVPQRAPSTRLSSNRTGSPCSSPQFTDQSIHDSIFRQETKASLCAFVNESTDSISQFTPHSAQPYNNCPMPQLPNSFGTRMEANHSIQRTQKSFFTNSPPHHSPSYVNQQQPLPHLCDRNGNTTNAETIPNLPTTCVTDNTTDGNDPAVPDTSALPTVRELARSFSVAAAAAATPAKPSSFGPCVNGRRSSDIILPLATKVGKLQVSPACSNSFGVPFPETSCKKPATHCYPSMLQHSNNHSQPIADPAVCKSVSSSLPSPPSHHSQQSFLTRTAALSKLFPTNNNPSDSPQHISEPPIIRPVNTPVRRCSMSNERRSMNDGFDYDDTVTEKVGHGQQLDQRVVQQLAGALNQRRCSIDERSSTRPGGDSIPVQLLRLDAATLDTLLQYNITESSQIPNFQPISPGLPDWKVHKLVRKNRESADAYAVDLRKWGRVPQWKRDLIERRQHCKTDVFSNQTESAVASLVSAELSEKLQRRLERSIPVTSTLPE